MGLTGQLAGGKLSKDLRIYVDPAYGDDTAGQKYREDKPFATIQAAADVFSDGDIIEVNGVITLDDTVTFGNNGTNFILHFVDGCTVETNFNAVKPMFTTIGAQNYEIHGRGSFNNGYLPSPGNNGPRVFSMGTGGTFEIFGAKSISSFGGVPINASGWLNMRNVDEIFSLNSISFITGFRSDRDGVKYGFIENCTFKRPNDLGVTYLQAIGSGQKIIINDCKFIGGGGAGATIVCTNNVGNLSTFELNRCRIQSSGAARGVWFTTGEATYTFNDCHIETETQVGVLVGGDCTVNFRDCKVISQTLCFQYAVDNPTISFHGTNTMITTAAGWVVGPASNKVRNTGVILSNKRPGFLGSQIWRVTGFTTTPVPGDDYSVIAEDGTVATYTVLGGDTKGDLVNGLRDACIAKGQETNNDMTDWIFTTVGAVGSEQLQILASSPDYNYDLDEGEEWDASTTGVDVLTTSIIGGTAGFTMVGGQFLIDANLTL